MADADGAAGAATTTAAATNSGAATAASPRDPPASASAQQAGPTPPASQPPTTAIDATLAPSGAADDGLRKRPRDARLIHMILANQGVTAYQERVPLQLLDFCYRYTSSTLQDALHLTAEFGQSVGEKGGKIQTAADLNAVSLPSLRLSIASRSHYQLSHNLPKDHLTELATEKNKVALPPVGKDWGMRLPPERYVLSGVGYALREEWESEGEEDVDVAMKDGAKEDEEDEDEEVEGGRMQDLYGEGVDEDMDTKED